MKSVDPSPPTKSQVLWRGLRERCPCCGIGKLFTAYIKQVACCTNCGEQIGAIRADDGPAWLTILLTGHIIAPFFGYFALLQTASPWLPVTILLGLALGLSFFLLPRTKGLFIAALWLTSREKTT